MIRKRAQWIICNGWCTCAMQCMVHVQHMHVTRACIYKNNSLRMLSAKNYFVSTYSYTSHSMKVGWLLLVKQSIEPHLISVARLHCYTEIEQKNGVTIPFNVIASSGNVYLRRSFARFQYSCMLTVSRLSASLYVYIRGYICFYVFVFQ